MSGNVKLIGRKLFGIMHVVLAAILLATTGVGLNISAEHVAGCGPSAKAHVAWVRPYWGPPRERIDRQVVGCAIEVQANA